MTPWDLDNNDMMIGNYKVKYKLCFILIKYVIQLKLIYVYVKHTYIQQPKISCNWP